MPQVDPSKNSAPWFAYLLIGVGVAAVAAGLSWDLLVPDEAFWSDTQAEEYEHAYEAAHAASIGPGHTHSHSPGEDHQQPVDLEQAKARFKAIHQQLAAAKRARGTWGKILSVGGVALAVSGLVVLRKHAAE